MDSRKAVDFTPKAEEMFPFIIKTELQGMKSCIQ